MFRGFNLEIDIDDNFLSKYYENGVILKSKNESLVENVIKSFEMSNGVLDGSKMSNDWFPMIDADIFISHSHNNFELAVSLAGWLKETFNINSFIDSCVWKYADDLLTLIDKKYCRNPGKHTYNYEKRNCSTSHVHMMLSTALSQMIDNTECLIFLNTPDSITPQETISGTLSPWIYSEISMTRLIRQKTPFEHRKTDLAKATTTLKKALYEQYLTIMHKTNLDHLTPILEADLLGWEIECMSSDAESQLDVLYLRHPIK